MILGGVLLLKIVRWWISSELLSRSASGHTRPGAIGLKELTESKQQKGCYSYRPGKPRVTARSKQHARVLPKYMVLAPWKIVKQKECNTMNVREKFYIRSVQEFNDFAQEATKEPDYLKIKDFALNAYFASMDKARREEVAGAYARLERSVASPDDLFTVMEYYAEARNAFRTRGKVIAFPLRGEVK